MENAERDNVYKVYDKIANWFADNRLPTLIEKKYLDDLIVNVGKDASVLDVGCGTGKPILDYLINLGLKVTGVDASTNMLNIARSNFPSIEFIQADMRQLALNKKFDAIIAWHSFFHLTSADQPMMFEIFARHLKPKGILLFTSGTEKGEAWGAAGGENLFHASLDTAGYAELLELHNFEILNHVENDPNCGGATIWMAKNILLTP